MAVGHLIAGKAVAGASGRFADVFDPATGQVTKQVALASRAEVDAAVAAAAAAFPGWSATPAARRAKVMFKFKQLVEAHADACPRCGRYQLQPTGGTELKVVDLMVVD